MTSDVRIIRRPWSSRTSLWCGIGLLLLPLIAMQFTREVNWDATDFLAAAALIGGVGLAIEAAKRFLNRPIFRTVAIVSAVSCGLLIWAELAVGILR